MNSNSNNNIKKRIEKRRKRKKRVKILIVISLILIGIFGIVLFNIPKNKVEESVKELPLRIDSTPVTLNIVEVNKTKSLEATFKNDSEETITRLTLEVKLKDTGEVIEMKYNETVSPGETSNKFLGNAPKSGKIQDVEILKYKISLSNGTYMEYNVNLKQYNWS